MALVASVIKGVRLLCVENAIASRVPPHSRLSMITLLRRALVLPCPCTIIFINSNSGFKFLPCRQDFSTLFLSIFLFILGILLLAYILSFREYVFCVIIVVAIQCSFGVSGILFA